MLNLSKVEEGGFPVHYVQSDLVAFVRLIVDSFRDYATMRKLELHYEPETQQLMMDVDPEKLEESVSNLLSNAIKYTPEGGEVFVSLRMPDTDHSPEKKVEISVHDSGIGIPKDQLDKIFIRFYRVEDKRFPYQEGTGIGLTLVNEYMKMLNGTIRVNSAPDEGSEFVITLPVTQNAPVEKNIHVKGTFTRIEKQVFSLFKTLCTEWGHPRLLIVEDNKELTMYLKGLLGNDYQLMTAENGILGIEQATEHIPDIILSDVMMPGRDGYQVCRELKNDFLTNHIPVVLLTARADSDSRITGLECGADAYLTKPFDKKELMACLHNVFVQREMLRLKYQAKLYEKIPEKRGSEQGIKFLNQVLSVLETSYHNENFRIDELYHHLGISRVQLHRKLTALTGQTTSNFIRSFRLHKARKLLLESDKNVSEIAYETGFADPNYFTRVFTEENGTTPTELRKSFV
jgi:DNA-binding response OmpR family regulator/two-component sensor histidine kinase